MSTGSTQLRARLKRANVPAVQPALGVKSLRRVLGILEAKYVSDWVCMSLLCGRVMNLEVSAEDIGASEANFSARRVRGRQIVHFRHVAQANFVARHGAADVAGRHVTNARESGGSAAPGATR